MLCSQTDVEMRIQVDFDDDADPVCAALIAAAQGHIEREVGRPIEDANYTEIVDGPWGSYIWLKNPPVNSIASVTVDGTLLVANTDYLFTSDGRIARVSTGYPLRHWDAFKLQTVVVVYNGGYATPPADLVDICAWSAARAFQIGAAFAAMPVAAFIESVTLAGSDSVAYSDVGKSLSAHIALTEADLDACHYYRLVQMA